MNIVIASGPFNNRRKALCEPNAVESGSELCFGTDDYDERVWPL